VDVTCGACGEVNESGRKFCGECGSPLAVACASCGTPNAPGAKFCGECGAPLAAQPGPSTGMTPQLQAERRLVSVLFADLVGFTSASEGRDAEDTRELLTRYFDLARTTIERYGGTVEKFIGDAVMAVWGAPVANEDDAERAVRAALELVAAIPALDSALQARAGVLTGEAAVTLGAEGQGMVAGDLVNTASRIQSAAEPGTVLVGEGTRRAAEAAVAFEAAGAHELKGKSEAVSLWRALRVVAARGGEGRSTGLEAPFVGRDRELRLAKDVFHATAEEGHSHLLSVVGVAGIGKSRLAWEFEKYVDGLVEQAWWHRGRCLAYGEGVAYWALAEMIRMRARIAEDDPPETALEKLAAVTETIVTDSAERAFVEPRLQHLLGLTDRVAPDRQDLFSGWRLFLERMADQYPVILVVEDIQWADAALIEFLEYLLEWSRAFPIFVLTLARPEVSERHERWGAGIRSFTSLQLEPLLDEAIDALLRGLVPGLPDEAVARIRERADGIPLYAVETVRTLLDRGMLETTEDEYRVVGDLSDLDVPETLHALIASRLDGLPEPERRCLQDAAVLGKTFSARGLAALSPHTDDVEGLLTALVRKELLFLDTDPRSPERGQYGFLQALVQRVAYETLARRDRKAKHLAAAAYLVHEAGIDPDEIAEVIAAHYLDAARADVDAPESGEIRATARDWLERAGERSLSLAAADEAQRSFEAAAELADEPVVRAGLLERAGRAAASGARMTEAERLFTAARDLFAESGDRHAAARATAGLARALFHLARAEEALRSGEEAYAVLAADEPDEGTAALAAELARITYFAGDHDRALEYAEAALTVAERERLAAVLSGALNTKSLCLLGTHSEEALALVRHSLAVALEHELAYEALRAYNNLIVTLEWLDRHDDVTRLSAEALDLARRRGERLWLEMMAEGLASHLGLEGRWDEALAVVRENGLNQPAGVADRAYLVELFWERELGDELATALDVMRSQRMDEASTLGRTQRLMRELTEARLDGRPEALATHSLELIREQLDGAAGPWAIPEGLRGLAAALPELDRLDPGIEGIELVRPRLAEHPPRILVAQFARLEGVVASLAGEHDAAVDRLGAALGAARSCWIVPWTMEILCDYADALLRDDHGEEAVPLVAEAREIGERLGAFRTLERIAAVEARLPAVATTV
jgi:class 3 adenylate cyclase/tetratricopeptide (TPR) repeat protein